MSEKKGFKIQVPQDVVRNKDVKVSDKSFVLLVKLIQFYYSQSGDNKSLNLEFDHEKIMYHINMSDKRTFKSCLGELYQLGFITKEVSKISKREPLEVSISEKVISQLNKGNMFVQLESELIHRDIIHKIGYSGIRILYYLMSYINYNKIGKDHCYASIIRMSTDLHMAEKTFIKYIETLESIKFIRVIRYDAIPDPYYNDEGRELYTFKRYNNHYFIKHEQFKKYIDKVNKTA